MRELTYGPFGQSRDISPRRVQSGAATRADNGDDQSAGRCLMDGMACGGHIIVISAANGVQCHPPSHLVYHTQEGGTRNYLFSPPLCRTSTPC